jgi:hypothetical protein
LQSLPQYQVFSKPKEPEEDPKIKTCSDRRCGDTTKLLNQKPGRGNRRRKGKVMAKEGEIWEEGAAHKSTRRHVRKQTAQCNGEM